LWIYIHDQDQKLTWSAARQPSGSAPDNYRVEFHPHKIEFQRQDHGITTRMEITVPPEEDLEIRRLTLTNHTDEPRRLTLYSYAEVSLAKPADDRRHPAFNKLFIESEYLPELHTLVFHRRPRSSQEKPVFLAHQLVCEHIYKARNLHCCARREFLGRNGSLQGPAIFYPDHLSASERVQSGDSARQCCTGLDPILSLGLAFSLPAHKSIKVAYLSAASSSKERVLEQLKVYQSSLEIERGFEQAESFMEQALSKLEMNSQELAYTEQLLSLLMYPHAALRAPADTLAANQLGQPELWKFAISGDNPIILARIANEEESGLVLDLLKAHTFWRSFDLQIDLVFLNLGDTGYDQDLNNLLVRLVQKSGAGEWVGRRGGIFLLHAEQMIPAERTLLESAARAILDGQQGALQKQLANTYQPVKELPQFVSTFPPVEGMTPPPVPRPVDLLFDNGLGGFRPDGKEYQIYLPPGACTPAPWINVIANSEFGFTISEAGGGFTWAQNSGENRLTPWRNDPLLDLPAEAIYLRDEETGQVWSPTPQPAPAGTAYLVQHGAGYTIFKHNSHGIKHSLRVFALPHAPVKALQLRLENTLPRTRRISATCYAEWTLGTDRETMQQYVLTEFNTIQHAILAHNPYNVEFGERVAFLSSTREPTGLTTDRCEFLGPTGNLHMPAALKRFGLTGSVKAGSDPCAVLQNLLWIAPGEVKEITFLLGQGQNQSEALDLLERYRDIHAIQGAWHELNATWDEILGQLQVATPDPAMDLMLNRWLQYQALSCRIWGRSALYQSSGAFGFRDQLQDVLCLLDSQPDIARDHILNAASRQFEAGDVLHWWHPPSGRGVRTRCSDDLLWLPYVTAQYVARTGDDSLLSERIPFLQGEPLSPEEHDRYAHYQPGEKAETLFEHCRRALEKGTTKGNHGLPFIGAHDWNDGLNRVGIQGEGESVWNAWFLYTTLKLFARLCEAHSGDTRLSDNARDLAFKAGLYHQQASELQRSAEANAWDGEWYLRAFYDDGVPLGSKHNLEAKIDSLAQSWAVLSQAADPQRARQAMQSVWEQLVLPEDGLVLLFKPPFDHSERDPGYIQGYAPGIRENGGQYTHAATWVAWAFTGLGAGDRAGTLFRLLNPICHGDTAGHVNTYGVEPYIIAADVYGAPPYTGRGGWTWYTGSASWMYRLGVEAILGLQREGDLLKLNPCIPSQWTGYTVTYRYGSTSYTIQVENPEHICQGIRRVQENGTDCPDLQVRLVNDRNPHLIVAILGDQTRQSS
jgi:cyclic beta-1,2-glucan synthetase